MLDKLATIGRFGLFAGGIARRAARRPVFYREVVAQLWTTSIRCVLPVVAVTFPFGMVMALQGLEIFRIFGAERMLSSLISIATLRELSPVLASVLVRHKAARAVQRPHHADQGRARCHRSHGHRLPEVPRRARVIMMTIACPLLNIAGRSPVWAVYTVYLKASLAASSWRSSGLHGADGCLRRHYQDHPLRAHHRADQAITAFATGDTAGVGKAVNDTVVHGIVAFIR